MPNVRTSLSFILIAFISGTLFYLIVFSLILSKPSFRDAGKQYLFGGDDDEVWASPSQSSSIAFDEVYTDQRASTSLAGLSTLPSVPSATPTLAGEDGLLELSVDELRAMVRRTKGYVARDWSLSLGWNNMRYIIEAAVLDADLMNRTLVLPSFVYARACEYHNEVCAKYARMVNRGDAVNTDEWRTLPIEKQMGFVIPIEVMIDIPHLRQHHNVMMMTEYIYLQGLNATRERSNGSWDREYYHSGVDLPSLYVIQNHIYEPQGIVRVDKMPPVPTGAINATGPASQFGGISDANLQMALQGKDRAHLDWSEAKDVLKAAMESYNITSMEEALDAAGWVVLHTWDGALGMDWTKTVVDPIKQVARYSALRGFIDEFAGFNQDVVLFEGELHLGRKPGFVKYTTIPARDNFARTVLYHINPSQRVKSLAAKIVKRMDKLNHGRLWLAGHMRRGDFVNVGWAMEGSIRDHLGRILHRLANGRQLLERIQYTEPQPYDVPDVHPNNFASRQPPLDGSFIYLATDERSEEGQRMLRESHMVLFSDLVTMTDRRDFGWPLLYSDVIALVEQQIIGSGAAYFYAHAMSSVAGGILNVRGASGCDSRTALLD